MTVKGVCPRKQLTRVAYHWREGGRSLVAIRPHQALPSPVLSSSNSFVYWTETRRLIESWPKNIQKRKLWLQLRSGGGKWNESRMKFWDDAAAADMIPNLWFYRLVNVFFFFFFCLRFWNSLFSRPKYLSGFSSSSSSSSLVWDGLIKWNVVLLPRSAIFLQNWQNVKKASPFIKCANGFSDSECPKNARGLLISGRRERASSAKVFTLMVISFFFRNFLNSSLRFCPLKVRLFHVWTIKRMTNTWR